MLREYSNPVAQLLTYGECKQNQRGRDWPDYLKLGLTQTNVPELIRMATDRQLHRANGDSLEVWAPLHAWRSLAQLKAEDAARPILEMLEELEDDDWFHSELPRVMSMIGPSAIPVLAEFMANDRIEPINRIEIPDSLGKIAQTYPGHRKECTEILNRQMEKFEAECDVLNAYVIGGLVDLGETKYIATIREAFSRNCVDLQVLGDVEDVEIMLKLREKRDTPRRRLNPFTGEEILQLDEPTPVRRQRKVGRNDPCPCGSGKKFKKCCLQ